MTHSIVLKVVVTVVAIVFVLGTWLRDGEPDVSLLRFLSAASSAVIGLYFVWDYWLWRTSLLQRLPRVPRNVRGTWQGTLTSFWVDPATQQRPPAKSVYLVVHQTASQVVVQLLTDESKSVSAVAFISEVNKSTELAYLYANRPDMRFEDRSRVHYGATVLNVAGNPAVRLQGRYWTDRDSKGELCFGVRNSGKLGDDFVGAVALFCES